MLARCPQCATNVRFAASLLVRWGNRIPRQEAHLLPPLLTAAAAAAEIRRVRVDATFSIVAAAVIGRFAPLVVFRARIDSGPVPFELRLHPFRLPFREDAILPVTSRPNVVHVLRTDERRYRTRIEVSTS